MGPRRPEADCVSNREGPFKPNWESLKQYECPEWFRDAKFGIWACWSPQCVPEQGDWYARQMYIQGASALRVPRGALRPPVEVRLQGHLPPVEGREVGPREADAALQAGRGEVLRRFMVNHHCNFDAGTRSTSRGTRSTSARRRTSSASGPRPARKNGLRFGVTVHAARTWNWFDVAHGSDKSGPLAGVPYDGMLTKADGKGQWWEGYDPADLYGPHGAARTPEADQAYVEKWFNRTKDLIDKYHPDLLYFDDG